MKRQIRIKLIDTERKNLQAKKTGKGEQLIKKYTKITVNS